MGWDIVFSDYALPGFGGPQALEIFKESRADIPFILVSGTVGEELAIELVKAGADDFILKGNWARLIPMTKRELARYEARREQAGRRAQLLEIQRPPAPNPLAQKVHALFGPRALFGLGVLLFALAAVWKFALAPQWTQRIPDGWSWEAKFIGFTTWADPATGQFPEQNAIAVYRRSIANLGPVAGSNAVRLHDAYTQFDPATGATTWEYITEEEADPRTGQHAVEAFRGEWVVFPRNVQKTAYRLHSNYLEGVEVTYQGEEVIEGVTTYLFAYQGRGEYTESYAGTADYPGVPVDAGQEIKCADDQLVYRAWVEPVTGEVLKLDESCASGDYIYDIATGRALTALSRWGGVTVGDDVVLRAEAIRAERARLLWLDVYIPALLLAGGLVAVGLWVRSVRSVRSKAR